MSAPAHSPPRPAYADFFDRRTLLVLLLLTVAFYWKLALSVQFTFLETPQAAYQAIPGYQFLARAMHSGVIPLWDPYQWSGQPVLGLFDQGASFPLNWPLFLAPLRDGYLQLSYVHLHFVLMHFLAAAFMYAFCRSRGSSKYASVAAGAAFSFGGYVGAVPWPAVLHGAMWVPLAFLFFHSGMETAALRPALFRAVCCGASLGLSLLSGHYQASLFTLLGLGGLFLYFLFARPESARPTRRQSGLLFAAVMVCCFLVAALQLLPAWEYGTRVYRWTGQPEPAPALQTVPYDKDVHHGLLPLSMLAPMTPKGRPAPAFLGWTCLSLAVFAVAACWSSVPIRMYSALALGAAAYAAGHHSLFYGLLYSLVPGLDKATGWGGAIAICQFAVLAVAARGMDQILDLQQKEGERWRSRIAKAVGGVGLFCWALLLWLYLIGKLEADAGDSIMLSALAALALSATLSAFFRGVLSVGATRILLSLVLLFELAASSHLLAHRSDPQRAIHLKKLAENRDVVAFLKEQPRPFRFDVHPPAELPANLGDWEGLESTRGRPSSVSAALYDFLRWDPPRTSLLLNTVYVVAREPADPGQEEVFSGAEGWKVFRNREAFPRAWIVHAVRQAPDMQRAAELFRSPGFDARREAILVGSSAPSVGGTCPGPSKVELVRHSAQRVEARSSASCPALVVFAEPFFPGWRATVNGRPAALHAVFGALRGVEVPAGENAIQLQYRPLTVYLGAVLSAAGLLMVIVAGWASHISAASR